MKVQRGQSKKSTNVTLGNFEITTDLSVFRFFDDDSRLVLTLTLDPSETDKIARILKVHAAAHQSLKARRSAP